MNPLPNTRRAWFHSIGPFFSSVRFRLSLWFALVLGLVLLVFSGFVYYRTMQDVREQTATRLIVRLSEMNAAFLSAYRAQQVWGWWSIPGGDEPFVLKESEVVVVSDPEGAAAGSWGAIDEVSSVDVAAMTADFRYEKNTGRFFTYKIRGEDGSAAAATEYVFSAVPVLYQNRLLGWIILGQPEDPAGQLPRLRLTLVIASAATLLAAVAGGAWLAGRALWPVKAITRAAREISETDLSRRLNIHTRDELGELAGTFDQMLDRLQAAFVRQRQFTADASHELRTPLTIISLETNRALDGKRSLEDTRRALQVIQSENEFMNRLVGELLTLARMDAGQLELKREQVDLSDLALEAVERYEQLAAQKNIRMQAGDLPELPITGDRTLLLQMIGNLVDNAIKYSPPGPGQWVRVETGLEPALGAAPSAAWVRVSDNGPGIGAEHIAHLFDRFYRADTARSHNPGDEPGAGAIPGSGLGLAIVQQIAALHGGSASVTSEKGAGAVFEVRFPSGQFPVD